MYVSLSVCVCTRKIGLRILKDHVHGALLLVVLCWFRDDNLAQFHNVDMLQVFEDFDLSDGGDRKALLLIVHLHLLERYKKMPCLILPSRQPHLREQMGTEIFVRA